MFKPINPITEVNGYAIGEGWYAGFETATLEESRAALHEGWAVVRRNGSASDCPRCRGRGYTRADGNVGCEVCHGRGIVNE